MPGLQQLSAACHRPVVLLLLLVGLLVGGGCGWIFKPRQSEPEPRPTVMTRDGGLERGAVLTDADNHTLYFDQQDIAGTGPCADLRNCDPAWRPFYQAELRLPFQDTPLRETDFGTFTTAANQRITTYKGWPLYTYAPGGVAEPAGATTGDGVAGRY